MIKKDTRDLITAQSLKEISFSRRYKQGKIKNWQKNEEMYYGVKKTQLEARANVELGRMQEFVHTLLSKIDNPLLFKFQKRKEAQLKRVELLNALRTRDQQLDNWDIKDLVGKKQAIIYGRTIYTYYADSINNYYKPHLENTDVYDFLIDPSGGGIDIENAFYMGRYGVVKTKKDLKQGLNDKIYLKLETQNLIDGVGNNIEENTEEQNKSSREKGQGTAGDDELQNDDKYKFWQWFTTYEGERYYLLLQEKTGTTILCEKLVDIFPATKEFPEGAWPFWTWAAFPDLTEFWTPSYCDYVREIFMAQNVSIDQMLDNAEAINKPQKVVNVGAIENLAELKYRKDGIIHTKKDYDANKAVQMLQVPSINTPIEVFNVLEGIQEKALGVTAGAKGVADEEGKVGIYEGNQQAMADRFGLLNKSYAFGYTRFAKLYEMGVREHLTKKVAVDITGPNGIETQEITRKDIFRKSDDFGVLVEASNAEILSSERTQSAKLNFLTSQIGNPIINQKKLFEMEAKIAGFTEEEMEQLTDLSEFGNAELMSEAERDIEKLLDGEIIKPNQNANNAYKQRIVNFMKDKQEDMDEKQFANLTNYVISLDEIILQNEARALNQFEINKLTGVPAIPQGIQNGGIPQIKNNPVEQKV